MYKKRTISLIIPCRNEEDALKSVLSQLPKLVDEVIVVDNLSTDQTVKVARSFNAKVLTETRNENGIGYGYAIANGINQSTGDIIACLDGDGSYPVAEIPNILKHLIKNKLDFISCSRSSIKDKKSRSLIRKSGVNILNFFIWILYGYKIKDSLSGMWIFKKNLVDDLNLFEGGWNFSEEIKLSAISSSKIKFAEYAISYHDRIFNQSKLNIFQAGFNYFLFLFEYKYNQFKWALKFSPKVSLLEN